MPKGPTPWFYSKIEAYFIYKLDTVATRRFVGGSINFCYIIDVKWTLSLSPISEGQNTAFLYNVYEKTASLDYLQISPEDLRMSVSHGQIWQGQESHKSLANAMYTSVPRCDSLFLQPDYSAQPELSSPQGI